MQNTFSEILAILLGICKTYCNTYSILLEGALSAKTIQSCLCEKIFDWWLPVRNSLIEEFVQKYVLEVLVCKRLLGVTLHKRLPELLCTQSSEWVNFTELTLQQTLAVFFLSAIFVGDKHFVLKRKVYDTGSSQAVPHPSTIPARQCLTSVIGRERVYSLWYGRRQLERF